MLASAVKNEDHIYYTSWRAACSSFVRSKYANRFRPVIWDSFNILKIPQGTYLLDGTHIRYSQRCVCTNWRVYPVHLITPPRVVLCCQRLALFLQTVSLICNHQMQFRLGRCKHLFDTHVRLDEAHNNTPSYAIYTKAETCVWFLSRKAHVANCDDLGERQQAGIIVFVPAGRHSAEL